MMSAQPGGLPTAVARGEGRWVRSPGVSRGMPPSARPPEVEWRIAGKHCPSVRIHRLERDRGRLNRQNQNRSRNRSSDNHAGNRHHRRRRYAIGACRVTCTNRSPRKRREQRVRDGRGRRRPCSARCSDGEGPLRALKMASTGRKRTSMGLDCGFRRSRPCIPIGSRPPIPI